MPKDEAATKPQKIMT
jgi:hypothetical protein